MEAQAIAACVAATAAVIAAFNGSRTLKRTRLDSRERNRPMVVAELREVPYSEGTQILVVSNCGQTVAREVIVTFDPPLPPPDSPNGGVMTPFLVRRYAEPIAVLVPGVELDNIWFSRDRPGGENTEPCPDQCTVTVAYRGPDGHPYSDLYPIDTNLIRCRTYVTSSRHPESIAKESLKAGQKAAVALDRLARSADAAQRSRPPGPARTQVLLSRARRT
jgi:hypothetical protein